MTYVRSKGIAWRRIGGETVIVNLGRRRMIALNESGSAVWSALPGEAGSSEDEPAKGPAFRADGGEALASFFADLETEGVLERDEAASPSAAVGLPASLSDGPPAVVWREELNRFGGSCGLLPSQSPLCDQIPFNS